MIPLEGEGQVEQRVELLYKLLTDRRDWIDALRSADAVFVAAHSQGCPVATALLARLIGDGDLDPHKAVLLCMASVASGPFLSLGQSSILAPYFAYVEGEAARELFQFQNPDSAASKWYRKAVTTVLEAGVKILAVASLDDQVVPTYSGARRVGIRG